MLPRFFCAEQIFIDHIIELPENIRHHATHVLRLKQGDAMTLFDGNGGEFLAQILQISKSNTTVKINKHIDIECESPLVIELAQAICANEKMDWIIQKSVELGASRIHPILTNRCVVRLSHERALKRLLHWQQIAIAACEQCGRNRIPEVLPLASLPDWLAGMKAHESSQNTYFMLSPTATKYLRDFSKPSINHLLTILIGPEGGLTKDEETIASLAGFVPLCLGKRILRTESAALASIAAMQTLWGDY
ncbi:MAG: 16S rRNA (uracil(1498)-N(3))-methyltransferase [Nitrosomonas sp.]|nr:16S rRNA (uracil(1498)-N(3))-methyltransferase [Nitrosomonas sp.]MDP1951774.1 16S rRNA (uracil(1498)-N(3))-methyltransferase [Nitrosomonas sp.]